MVRPCPSPPAQPRTALPSTASSPHHPGKVASSISNGTTACRSSATSSQSSPRQKRKIASSSSSTPSSPTSLSASRKILPGPWKPLNPSRSLRKYSPKQQTPSALPYRHQRTTPPNPGSSRPISAIRLAQPPQRPDRRSKPPSPNPSTTPTALLPSRKVQA